MLEKKEESKIAKIIDGKALANDLISYVKYSVDIFILVHKIDPALAVILVGDDPASKIYVKNKEKVANKVGIKSIIHRLPKGTSQDSLLYLIEKLNKDESIHGILVQLPLPELLDEAEILKNIDPAKDVDGLHIENIGRLYTNISGLIPCTPLGCISLIKQAKENLEGLHAVVIGRSNLVGKPLAQLLLRENCTVTICHSKTRNISQITREADILVAAVGSANMVKADWVKAGAIVIDVGINRTEEGKLTGDVDFDEVSKIAGYITPVPGGVGPMTIASLLLNTIKAISLANNIPLLNPAGKYDEDCRIYKK